MGLLLMAAAGYDPAEAPAFWDRMPTAPGARDRCTPPPIPPTRPASPTPSAGRGEADPLYRATDPQSDRVLPRQ